MQKIFNKEEYKTKEYDCKNEKIGCKNCKQKIIYILQNIILPIKEKRDKNVTDKDYLIDIINKSYKKAQIIAKRKYN